MTVCLVSDGEARCCRGFPVVNEVEGHRECGWYALRRPARLTMPSQGMMRGAKVAPPSLTRPNERFVVGNVRHAAKQANESCSVSVKTSTRSRFMCLERYDYYDTVEYLSAHFIT